MARRIVKRSKASSRMLPLLHRTRPVSIFERRRIFVAVPADRAEESVRSFGTFTRDLHQLADWLQSCRVTSVAMESTRVYWIPLYQIFLSDFGATRSSGVSRNAQHVKNVLGRKSDVSECQWIQYLHSVGLRLEMSSIKPFPGQQK